jgi:hypothetical protein
MARKDLIQHRRDTAPNWTSVNPVLAASELGFETDTNKFKLGDGTSTWTALAYQGGSGVSLTPSATQTIVAQNATTTPLIVKGAASQSADLFSVQNSGAAKVLTVGSTGAVTLGSSTQGATVNGSLSVSGSTSTVGLTTSTMSASNAISVYSNGSNSAVFYNSQAASNTYKVASIDDNGIFTAQGIQVTNLDATFGAPVQGLGYATNTGGTVTQNTSKSTGVSLSKLCGTITMNAAALAAGTIVSFVLTNSFIKATDVLILNHSSGGTLGAYTLNASAGSGNATIYVRNNTSGSLSEAIVIRFAIINAVIA